METAMNSHNSITKCYGSKKNGSVLLPDIARTAMLTQPAMVPKAAPITDPAMTPFGPILILNIAPVIAPPPVYLWGAL